MEAHIVNHFAKVKVGEMNLTTSVQVDSGTRVRDVVAAMAAASQGAALVMSDDKIVGIFSERDITTKVAATPDRWDVAVDQFMTANPHTVRADESAFDALHASNTHRTRNLPVIDDAGSYVGTVTIYELIQVASRYLKSHTELGDEMAAEHSLLFVDLSGIEPHEALQISPDGSVAEVIEMMIAADTGLVSVVNERGAVIGEFTEHDLFTKLACQITHLEDEAVGDWFTTEIAGAVPTTSVADAIHLMATVGHRYLVLLNENNHALGRLTFRDIADYFETALQVVEDH